MSLKPPLMWQVLVGHVKEAFRLLSKSIIRVETPDINLEEEPEVPEPTGTWKLPTSAGFIYPLYNNLRDVICVKMVTFDV